MNTHHLALLLSLAIPTIALAAPPAPETPPPLGFTANVKVVEIVDGDTLTVEVPIRVRVRLLDCWAPEMHAKDVEARNHAQLARQHLIAIALNQPATIFVPTMGANTLGDIFTFDRILGRLWVYGEDVSKAQVKDGHVSSTKTGKLGE